MRPSSSRSKSCRYQRDLRLDEGAGVAAVSHAPYDALVAAALDDAGLRPSRVR